MNIKAINDLFPEYKLVDIFTNDENQSVRRINKMYLMIFNNPYEYKFESDYDVLYKSSLFEYREQLIDDLIIFKELILPKYL